ncbi:kelch-like protein 10 isoform X2 [Linepithema humile]|uniref:kelch-like protein 10 isoform X2 n=1 Tax=Linepithema humile TaxID=83485 RepID=UPI00351E4BE9
MDIGRMNYRRSSHCRVSRAATSGIGRLLKHPRRKQSARIRKCMCLPSNYALVEFPVVWSELRANQQLCDGVIRCPDQVFPVHRAILSAVSPYFKALFTNSLKGGKTETTEVVISSVPGEIFSLILDYAYTGTCNVNVDNVEQLLPLADQFEVLGIVQLCCQFLLQELRPENCLGIFKFARHYFCRDLEKQGRKYIRHHFKQILKESAEFKELLCDELEAILRDDELNVKNEEIVFDAVKTWVENRVEERRVYLPRLLECIRYGLMSHKYFINNIVKWKLVEEDEACQQILRPINAYLIEQDSKQNDGEIDLKNPLARPRIPYEILFAIGGWSAGSPTSFVETYDTRADRWFLSVNTDVTSRAYHGLCALNSLIYMIGGFDGNEHFNTVRCFDPVTKEWRERACMYHARCYVSVCAHGGKIYALGGYNGRTRMSSGERYEPQRNQWEMIPSMHRQRSDASAAALHDKIYIVGGFNGQEVLDSVEVFNVETNQWTNIHSMISPRSGVSLVAFHDSLYALGGFSGVTRLSSGERYTPNHSDQWHGISEMFSPRSNFATVILDDMIFAIGGYNGQATSKNREKSDRPGEGSTETNVIISAREDGQIDVSESAHVAGPTDGMADGIGNFNEENDNDEEEMQGELLYVVQQLD